MSGETVHRDTDGDIVAKHYELPRGRGTRFQLPNGEVVKVERYEGQGEHVTIIWPTKLTASEFFKAGTSAIGIPYTEVTLRGKKYLTVSQEVFAGLGYKGVSHVSLPDDKGVIGWQHSRIDNPTEDFQGAVAINGLSIDAARVEALMAVTGTEQVVANKSQLIAQVLSS